MTIVYLKQNDTKPDLQITVNDDQDAAIDVTDATIAFHMNDSAGTSKVDAAGAIVTAESGIIKYVWSTGDLDTIGTYNAEFQITFSDSSILTVPSKGYLTIVIGAELN